MDVPWLREIEADLVGTDEIVDIVALTGGEVNETVRVQCASGATLVIRRAPAIVPAWYPTIEGQVAAIQRAREAGVPTPSVVYASGRILAYEFIHGEALDPACVSVDVAREAGRIHGGLHAVQGDGIGPVQPDGTSPGWPTDTAFADVTNWIARLREAKTPLKPSDVEAAGALLDGYVPRPSESLLHGDASPSNTIASEGRIVSLIDFDDAWYGEPASDAAWWWWNSPDTGDAFVAGCAETYEEIDPVTALLYRLRLLLGLANSFATTMPDRAKRIGILLGPAVAEANSLTA